MVVKSHFIKTITYWIYNLSQDPVGDYISITHVVIWNIVDYSQFKSDYVLCTVLKITFVCVSHLSASLNYVWIFKRVVRVYTKTLLKIFTSVVISLCFIGLNHIIRIYVMANVTISQTQQQITDGYRKSHCIQFVYANVFTFVHRIFTSTTIFCKYVYRCNYLYFIICFHVKFDILWIVWPGSTINTCFMSFPFNSIVALFFSISPSSSQGIRIVTDFFSDNDLSALLAYALAVDYKNRRTKIRWKLSSNIRFQHVYFRVEKISIFTRSLYLTTRVYVCTRIVRKHYYARLY